MSYAIKSTFLLSIIPLLACLSGCQTTEVDRAPKETAAPVAVSDSVKKQDGKTLIAAQAEVVPKSAVITSKPANVQEAPKPVVAKAPVVEAVAAPAQLDVKAQRRLDAFLAVDDLSADQIKKVTEAIQIWFTESEALRADTSLSSDALKARLKEVYKVSQKEVMKGIFTEAQRTQFANRKK